MNPEYPFEKNKKNLWILLILSLMFVTVGAFTRNYENMLVAIPTLLLTLIALNRKDSLYLPPMFIVLLAVTLTTLQLTSWALTRYAFIDAVANFLLGIFASILGLMILLAMLKSSPEFDVRQPFFISFSAFCIGTALSFFLTGTTFWIVTLSGDTGHEIETFLFNMAFCIVGAALVGVLFYLNRHNGLFEHTLNRFLKDNADTLQIMDEEKRNVLKEIDEGESSRLEFKSTLRTNLKTGEKDPRMERAVLKTLVAFLNSRGGTLLIGVADDGTILGVDLQSFENSKDKFGLHLNNLIKTQIGSEFLPFIRFTMIDFDDRTVARVVCQVSDRPVFLTDGKEQIFYVRSGPSTIDLHGMELLYYANHNFGKSLKKRGS